MMQEEKKCSILTWKFSHATRNAEHVLQVVFKPEYIKVKGLKACMQSISTVFGYLCNIG